EGYKQWRIHSGVNGVARPLGSHGNNLKNPLELLMRPFGAAGETPWLHTKCSTKGLKEPRMLSSSRFGAPSTFTHFVCWDLHLDVWCPSVPRNLLSEPLNKDFGVAGRAILPRLDEMTICMPFMLKKNCALCARYPY
ncbi:hypothetical protein DVH24_010444, partial [Malus domestica]